MTEENVKFQQQILFDEAEKPAKELPATQAQVIVENSDWQEVDTLESLPDKLVPPRKKNWLVRSAFVLFSVLIGYELIAFFINGFAQNPVIASLYAVLLGLLSIIVSGQLFHEFRGLRQLKRRQKIQTQVQQILAEQSTISAQQLCQQISEQLPCDLVTEQEQQWQQQQNKELSDSELLTLYSRQVLSHVDEKALDKISKYSTESAILVALSPIAVVDMLVMIWRNTKMINEVAKLYGMNMSYWGRIKLIKQTFKNMVYAGASELITDVGADLVGADLLGKLSARMAQGLGAGMLTARLGIKAIEVCRPLPFQENQPKLRDVRIKVVGQIKQLVNKTEKAV